VSESTTALALKLTDGKLYEDVLAGSITAAQAKDVSYIRSQIAGLIEYGATSNSTETAGVGKSGALDFSYVVYGESSTDPAKTSAYVYSGYYAANAFAKGGVVDVTKLNIASLAEVVGVSSVGDLATTSLAGIVTTANKAALGLS